MSNSATLLQVLVVYAAAAVTPGPNVLLIIRVAASSRRSAMAVAAGVVTGGGLLAVAATFGLGAVLDQQGWLLPAMRVFCGAYLAYLGLRLFSTAARPLGQVDGAVPERASTWYLQGLITNLTNPKAAVFFGSVLTAMLPPSVPGAVRATAVGMIIVCSTFWHVLVAVLLSTPQAQRGYRRAKPTLNRCVGALLGVFGVRLLLA